MLGRRETPWFAEYGDEEAITENLPVGVNAEIQISCLDNSRALVEDGTLAHAWRFAVHTPWMKRYEAPTWPSKSSGTWVYVPHPPASPPRNELNSHKSCTTYMSKSMVKDLKKQRAQSPRFKLRSKYHARARVAGVGDHWQDQKVTGQSNSEGMQIHVPDEIPDDVDTIVRKVIPRFSKTPPGSVREIKKLEALIAHKKAEMAAREHSAGEDVDDVRSRGRRKSKVPPWRQKPYT